MLVKNDNLLKTQAFKLKGRLYTFTVLHLLNDDPNIFEQQLEEVIQQAPRLFDKTPVVLDCSALDVDLDLHFFCESLRKHHILPVAVQGNHSLLAHLAQQEGLALLKSSAVQDKILLDEPIETLASKTKIQTTPVRSGQQVVNREGDLIITSSVSPGAEVLAEGNIHVYGALRGRALAGISGNHDARIFVQSLAAELVSIAGCYRLCDAIEPQQGPCQIYLNGDHMHIESLC